MERLGCRRVAISRSVAIGIRGARRAHLRIAESALAIAVDFTSIRIRARSAIDATAIHMRFRTVDGAVIVTRGYARIRSSRRIADFAVRQPDPKWRIMGNVLATNSALHEQVVTSAKRYVPPQETTAPIPLQLQCFGKYFDEEEADVGATRRPNWAWLLRHVFAIDVNVYLKCGGRMK